MNDYELQLYLSRIGLDKPPSPSSEGLACMQRAHLAAVPFENLDIVTGNIPLALDYDSLFDKIVVQRRGGICYELNLLFAEALRALGFDVALKGGRHPKYGDDMDHLFLLVRPLLDGGEWIADVGFAANFAQPLLLEPGIVQDDGVDRFRIEPAPEEGEGYLRILRMPGLAGDADPAEMFAFGPQTYSPIDCRKRCDWFSSAPESRFVQGPLVTLQLPNGRRTLSANHYIATQDGVRISEDVRSETEFGNRLREQFHLHMPVKRIDVPDEQALGDKGLGDKGALETKGALDEQALGDKGELDEH